MRSRQVYAAIQTKWPVDTCTFILGKIMKSTGKSWQIDMLIRTTLPGDLDKPTWCSKKIIVPVSTWSHTVIMKQLRCVSQWYLQHNLVDPDIFTAGALHRMWNFWIICHGASWNLPCIPFASNSKPRNAPRNIAGWPYFMIRHLMLTPTHCVADTEWRLSGQRWEASELWGRCHVTPRRRLSIQRDINVVLAA